MSAIKQAASTPTPWRINGQSVGTVKRHVCDMPRTTGLARWDDENAANAALIVRAVNAHAALVEALEACVTLALSGGATLGEASNGIKLARAALKLARGEG